MITVPGCARPSRDASAARDELIRQAVPAAVVVVLAQQPDLNGNVLTFQDCLRDGQSYIPIFRSKQSFDESTQGTVDKPVWRIDRSLFVSMLRGPETIILDVSLPDEIVTSGNELKRIFPEPFEPARRTTGQ